jgi:hypothetical protein
LVPLVLVPVKAIIAAPIEEEKEAPASRVIVTAPVPAPAVTNARQAWIRREFELKGTPPVVPISVKVNPAPVTPVTLGAMPVPRPQFVEAAQEVEVKAM